MKTVSLFIISPVRPTNFKGNCLFLSSSVLCLFSLVSEVLFNALILSYSLKLLCTLSITVWESIVPLFKAFCMGVWEMFTSLLYVTFMLLRAPSVMNANMWVIARRQLKACILESEKRLSEKSSWEDTKWRQIINWWGSNTIIKELQLLLQR